MQIYKIKTLLLVSIGFFVSGCEDSDVYSGFLVDDNLTSIECVKIVSFEPKIIDALKRELPVAEDKNCSYTINGYIHHVDTCNNPQVKSLGADFNGFVRLKVLDRDIPIYRVQSDFKSDEEAALKRVIIRLKKDIF